MRTEGWRGGQCAAGLFCPLLHRVPRGKERCEGVVSRGGPRDGGRGELLWSHLLSPGRGGLDWRPEEPASKSSLELCGCGSVPRVWGQSPLGAP